MVDVAYRTGTPGSSIPKSSASTPCSKMRRIGGEEEGGGGGGGGEEREEREEGEVRTLLCAEHIIIKSPSRMRPSLFTES